MGTVRAPAPEGVYDLHAHTTASDGICTPEELVERAYAAGLAGIAVSDHDSLAGVPRAQAAGRRLGVCVVPGIELSSSWERDAGEADGRHRADVHILGLFLSGLTEASRTLLEERLARRRAERTERGQAMVRRLSEAGLTLTWQDVAAMAGDGAVGRPHVARALIERGYVSTIEEAFDRYLSPGRPGYVPQPVLPTPQAIAWVHEAGGAAVWAHPGLSGLHADTVPWLDMVDALEADYPKHTAETRAFLRALAKARGLLVTGSSDCHGTPGRDRVGVCTTPASVVRELRRRTAPRSSGT